MAVNVLKPSRSLRKRKVRAKSVAVPGKLKHFSVNGDGLHPGLSAMFLSKLFRFDIT